MNVAEWVIALSFLVFSLTMAWGVQQFGILTNHKVGKHNAKRSRWCSICRDTVTRDSRR